MKRLILTLALFGLVSCASVKDTVITTAHVSLLDAEFDSAAITVLDLPLPPDAKLTVENVIEQLDVIRQELATLHKQNAGKIVLSLSQSYGYVERIRKLYLLGRAPVAAYYQSTGTEIPRALVNYEQSAIHAYNAIQDQLVSVENSVDVAEITGFLSLILRVYSAAHGVPAI